MNQVTGVLVANPGIKIDSFQEMRAIIRYLNIFDTFKFFIIEIIDRLFLADISPDDFYFAIIAVDPDYRGQGIGTFILENGVELAIDNNKKRVVLDVDMDNQGALRLYQRFGFVEFNKKSFSLFGWEKGAHNMEYVL
jgi:ribosomal protein S18 acetylase RimI-like enzyme